MMGGMKRVALVAVAAGAVVSASASPAGQLLGSVESALEFLGRRLQAADDMDGKDGPRAPMNLSEAFVGVDPAACRMHAEKLDARDCFSKNASFDASMCSTECYGNVTTALAAMGTDKCFAALGDKMKKEMPTEAQISDLLVSDVIEAASERRLGEEEKEKGDDPRDKTKRDFRDVGMGRLFVLERALRAVHVQLACVTVNATSGSRCGDFRPVDPLDVLKRFDKMAAESLGMSAPDMSAEEGKPEKADDLLKKGGLGEIMSSLSKRGRPPPGKNHTKARPAGLGEECPAEAKCCLGSGLKLAQPILEAVVSIAEVAPLMIPKMEEGMEERMWRAMPKKDVAADEMMGKMAKEFGMDGDMMKDAMSEPEGEGEPRGEGEPEGESKEPMEGGKEAKEGGKEGFPSELAKSLCGSLPRDMPKMSPDMSKMPKGSPKLNRSATEEFKRECNMTAADMTPCDGSAPADLSALQTAIENMMATMIKMETAAVTMFAEKATSKMEGMLKEGKAKCSEWNTTFLAAEAAAKAAADAAAAAAAGGNGTDTVGAFSVTASSLLMALTAAVSLRQ